MIYKTVNLEECTELPDLLLVIDSKRLDDGKIQIVGARVATEEEAAEERMLRQNLQ